MTGAGGSAEVPPAQMAESKASNAGVKDFATRRIADHRKMSQQLMHVTDSLGLTVPNTPDTTNAAAMEKLRGATIARSTG